MGLRWENFLSGFLCVTWFQPSPWVTEPWVPLPPFQGGILQLFYWKEVLWVFVVCVCLCVSFTLITPKHCPLLSFYLGWACREIVGRREERKEEFIASEVKASFYFPLLSLRALCLQDGIPGHVLPDYGPWRWWMIPKPQPFCLQENCLLQREGGCGHELVVSFWILPIKVKSKKKKKTRDN